MASKRKKTNEKPELNAKKKSATSDTPAIINLSDVEEEELIKNFKLNRLDSNFFDVECLRLSRSLLGKYLFRKVSNNNRQRLLIGKIVEVEAYLGGEDKASHSYAGKITENIKAMYMDAGTCYVYNIYGIYCCMNISSKEPGAAVLIRALEPISGIDVMTELRKGKKKGELNVLDLCSGPSKVCQAMNITKNGIDKVDICNSEDIWLQDSLNGVDQENFITCRAKRIGIDYAGEEAVNKLYRFFIKHSKYVSVKARDGKDDDGDDKT